jgi:uncharacterized membrane protein YhaH (DUF805 family)
MAYGYSKKRTLQSQRRVDRWRFWVFALVGLAITIGVVVLTFLK